MRLLIVVGLKHHTLLKPNLIIVVKLFMLDIPLVSTLVDTIKEVQVIGLLHVLEMKREILCFILNDKVQMSSLMEQGPLHEVLME